MDRDQAHKALLGINLVIGAAFLLMPKLSMRLYGLDPQQNPTAAYPVRYVGARSLVFAAMLADDDGSAALIRQMPVIAGVDATANVLAAATGEVPKRVAFLGALTSVVAAVLGFSNSD